jgi:CRISPR-associated endonuclease/helicase Cas3
MVTEVAPWASMVQRFGRLNRTGEETAAQAIWVDIKEPSPYNQEEIKEARERIKSLKDVSPESLAGVELPEKSKKELVLREHDLIGLYSTDKDLAGGFTDVSEYIRDSEDRNVYIGWRDFEKSPKDPLQGELESWELCPVPISETKPFRPKGHSLWEWNDEATRWERRFAGDIVPGMTLLCSASAGGYSETLGWTGDPSDRPHSTKAQISVNESTQSDPASVLPQWCALDVHLRRVTEEMERICSNLSLENTAREALTLAAKWHDIGKSLPEWQGAAKKAVVKSGGAWMEGIWAKFPAKRGTFRPGLRHEEASALYAAELLRRGDPGWSVLAVFLIACHHGKVRTTLGNYGVKSLRDVPDRRLRLPGMIDEPVEVTCDLLDFHGPGQFDAETGVMSIAGPSWTSLVNELVGSEDGEGKFGPFRLAFFEALIAAADARGSREKEE